MHILLLFEVVVRLLSVSLSYCCSDQSTARQQTLKCAQSGRRLVLVAVQISLIVFYHQHLPQHMLC
jgi:hypothetical protein